jgi:hypothetical protein
MNSFPIADGPHNDQWKELVPNLFPVVDEVIATHGIDFPIRIGGGSMLLRRYGHRKSRDLDVFVPDVRLVRWCSPRVNAAAEDLFPDYAEEAVATKLIIGMQEIDIIAAAPIFEDAAAIEKTMLFGRPVEIETPREILAKKLIYRPRLFLARDLFDLAAVAEAEPNEVAAVFPRLTEKDLAQLTARLKEIAPTFAQEIVKKVEPFPAFNHLLDTALGTVTEIVSGWREEREAYPTTRSAPASAISDAALADTNQARRFFSGVARQKPLALGIDPTDKVALTAAAAALKKLASVQLKTMYAETAAVHQSFTMAGPAEPNRKAAAAAAAGQKLIKAELKERGLAAAIAPGQRHTKVRDNEH